MTFLGWRTVREGDRAAIWSRSGKVKVVTGPKREKLWNQRFERLLQWSADQSEYIEVRKRAGGVEIIAGPSTVFFDPVADEAIAVKPAIQIDASQALVVYRHRAQPQYSSPDKAAPEVVGLPVEARVDRRIVRGPARFIPQADEWIHNFSWSGIPRDGNKTSLQPNADKFIQLSVIPTSLYHNVTEVRTNDDTLITVKLMLFFELEDIETMLSATNDPIADFINAASADVIAFCSCLNYENFLTLTGKLNEIETFAQLVTRAQLIGYKISKVVFRGFQAGEKLQAMHDGAIQERTRLRLKEETQEQAQRAEDLRLEGEHRRAARQAELETEQARLKAELALGAQEASLRQQKLSHDAALQREREQNLSQLESKRAQVELELELKRQQQAIEQQRNEEQLRMMREMKGLSVDLTKVLVSQHEQPDRVLKIDTGRGCKAEDEPPAKKLLGALQLNL